MNLASVTSVCILFASATIAFHTIVCAQVFKDERSYVKIHMRQLLDAHQIAFSRCFYYVGSKTARK